MNVAAEFSLRSDSLPFSDILSDGPVSRIRFVPTLSSSGEILPFFRFWSEDGAKAVEMLQRDPTVDSLTLLDRKGATGVVCVEWASEGLDWLRDGTTETRVVLLGATVTPDEWSIQVWAGAEADLVTFRQHCREADLDAVLTEVTTPAQEAEPELVTPAQQEALLRAVSRGYFDEPRAVTLDELGDEIGISRQAFAGRLRRGIRNLAYKSLQNRENGQNP